MQTISLNRSKQQCQLPWTSSLRFRPATSDHLKTSPDGSHQRNHRQRKNITRWISPEASQAKKERRRLERKWKRSGLEEDRQCYRRHCRFTNKLINESRSSYFRSQLESAENPRDRR